MPNRKELSTEAYALIIACHRIIQQFYKQEKGVVDPEQLRKRKIVTLIKQHIRM